MQPIILNKVGLGWIGFYGISTIVGYFMPISLHAYVLNIYDFSLVWFYGISTLEVI